MASVISIEVITENSHILIENVDAKDDNLIDNVSKNCNYSKHENYN